MSPTSDSFASPSRRRHGRSRMKRAGVIAITVFVLYLGVGIRSFVIPQIDPVPPHADVAEVLGWPEQQRIDLANRLLRQGVVDTVLISIPYSQRDHREPDPYWAARCAAAPHTVCRVASPWTTQGEARLLGALARANGWKSAVVITQTAQIQRARLIVGRCFNGPTSMLSSGESPEHGWPYQFAYQTVATAKAIAITNTC